MANIPFVKATACGNDFLLIDFAYAPGDIYGFSKRSLEQWEQGRRSPTGAARVFLTVIAREPAAVQRALRQAR